MKDSKEDISSFLRSLLVEKYSLSTKVEGRSRIYHDLKLRGDDAWEFLEEVVAKYNVDMTGFEFIEFFRGETYSLADVYRSVFGKEDGSRKPLTVDHLVAVCEAKKWFEPLT